MVQITERASAELRRLLTDHLARPQQGVRLRLNQAGDLAMTIDVPHTLAGVVCVGTAAAIVLAWQYVFLFRIGSSAPGYQPGTQCC